MKVGQLAALLEHVNLDDDIVVVVTPDLIENETGRVDRPITFDIDRIVTTVLPETNRSGDVNAFVRTVLHLRP